ncbi:hypothetical protein [Marinomonas sp. THO17]|uniref:bacteriophage T4 gp5 trimerisation domain-containing protein n=1 Tax=Marinomonas sp. THO17 TaxID=3149048 RepID=UPI00336C1F55
MHAQKDLKQQVLNDVQTDIGNDHHLTVANDSFTEVKNNQAIKVEGERRVQTTLDHSRIIKGNLTQDVGTLAVMDAQEELHLKSGDSILLDAGPLFTLKAGENFITIDENGINVVGGIIKVNTGGVALQGSGFAGQEAELPLGEELPEPNEVTQFEPTPALKQKLLEDQLQDQAVTELCQKLRDNTCPLSDCPCGNFSA